VARTQPVKLASLEGQFATQTHAPLRIGGLPDPKTRTTRFAIEIPGGLSVLAHGDPAARVLGLDAFPKGSWPPVTAVHLAFQGMVAIGTWLAVLAAWSAVLAWRGRLLKSRAFRVAVSLSTGLGFVALEAGWMVTELGRQPWIIQGLMRTAQAVTPVPGLLVPFVLFTLVYLGLGAVVIQLIRGTILQTARSSKPR